MWPPFLGGAIPTYGVLPYAMICFPPCWISLEDLLHSNDIQHPQIIDEELGKEVRAWGIVGPFDTPPIPNLQCSGVGVIPKTGGWRMIMHLSAPPDSSINDGIDKEEFTLRYATIDDAVQMINRLGSNSLLAKIDIKSAFRTLPVRVEDRELLGICWRQKYYVDCCLPFGLWSAPPNMHRRWNGFFVTTISFQTSFTTWTIF